MENLAKKSISSQANDFEIPEREKSAGGRERARAEQYK